MKNELKKIKIMLEYGQGPIWLSDIETGEPITGVDIIDLDSIVKDLNYKCAKLYSSYYEFDSHGVSCWFNYEKEKEDKLKMLSLIEKLVARLNEINDGTFIVEDCESKRLKEL